MIGSRPLLSRGSREQSSTQVNTHGMSAPLSLLSPHWSGEQSTVENQAAPCRTLLKVQNEALQRRSMNACTLAVGSASKAFEARQIAHLKVSPMKRSSMRGMQQTMQTLLWPYAEQQTSPFHGFPVSFTFDLLYWKKCLSFGDQILCSTYA